MTTTEAISIRGLVKRFGRATALDGLDLTVRKGEVHGLLGPNGAGKSTTLRVLLGLARVDAGTVSLLGGDPWHDAASLHHRLAYVPGDVALWPGLSGGESLDLLGRLRGGTDERRLADLVDRFALDTRLRGRAYSKGNRQKVALVAALAADTELLVLDEPTSGLDPLMEEVFRSTIAEERDRGRTVLLSSHLLSEVETLCDRVSIIRAGRTVESGTLAELRHLSHITVTAVLSSSPAPLAHLAGVHDMEVSRDRVRLLVEPGSLTNLCSHLASLGVRDLTARPPTLEELFLRHYDTSAGSTR